MNTEPGEILWSMRKAIVILTLDDCGAVPAICEGLDGRKPLSATERKAVRAALELGIVESDKKGHTRWSEGYRAIAGNQDSWRQFIAVLKHHATYLNLVQTESLSWGSGTAARVQARSDPSAYRMYLEGVAEAHRGRAQKFSMLQPLKGMHKLVDLGGGLGAYSAAWIGSHPRRTSTLVDIPEVVKMASEDSSWGKEQLTLRAADLTNISSLPEGDLYLLSNVLHLFYKWRSVVKNILSLAPVGSWVAILEAERTGVAGAFFDLQVHLRSSRKGGLIKEGVVRQFLVECGVSALSSLELAEVEDPLDRRYWLLLGRKASAF